MKTNVTLKLDAEILKEARVLAAEQGSSISRLLAEQLEELVRERKGYDRARKRALARLRAGMDLGCMSDKRFVDTNILVYAHDIAQGAKHQRARALVQELWETSGGVLSTQVLQELCVSLRRKAARPLSAENTRKVIEDYASWQVVVNTSESVLEALDLEGQYQISFWDALIIQAAESCGAEVLYSEDLADGQSYGGVRVMNPLK
jgi:predicted nucleic acid-binding protein